ncbi:glycosyltransferase family 4 protein [Patescibacteria group bacterium]
MRKKKLKIAFFHLAFVYSGGGERLVLQEMEGLRKRGHQVVCYTPFLDKKKCYPDLISKDDIRLIVPQWLANFLPRFSLTIILSFFWLLLKLGEFRKYDVFVGANQPGPLYCWLITRILKKPYLVYLAQPTRILYPRGVDREVGLRLKGKFLLLPFLSKIFQPLVIWMDRVSIQKAKKMLVNGSYMLGILKQIYGRDGVNCPAGSFVISKKIVNKWQGSVKITNVRVRRPFIFMSNRHFPQKKLEWMIDVFILVAKRFKGLSLAISGTETKHSSLLKKKVASMNLGKRVFFLGLVKDRDLAKLYKTAAVYVYSAPEEDFGMGLVEAMGSRTAVVAWNYAGPTSTVISGKTGILVEPYKIKKFAQAIKKLILNRQKNKLMAKQAAIHVKKNFTIKKHIDILENSIKKANQQIG